MKILMKKIGMLISVMLLTSVVQALPAGLIDITIYDGDGYLGNGNSAAGVGEDQETELGMVNSQMWDLEAFFVEDGTDVLGMVGGFDFTSTGNSSPYYYGSGKDFTAGDIFIDLENNHILGSASAVDGNGQDIVNTTFGYDLVVDIDWTSLENGLVEYSIYALNAESQTVLPYYDANYGSSPWKYVADQGDGNAAVREGSLSISTLTDNESGFLGEKHYQVSGIDLAGLVDDDYYVHFTMGCGNDNLMGHVTTEVPEPSSIVLLALGMIGLVVLRRKA